MNIERLKNFFKKEIVIDIIIFLLLAVLSLSWFRGNNLINGGDFGMPFDWTHYFKTMFSVWMEAYGAAAPRGVAQIFPYATFGALMQTLGFSLVFIEKVFFYFWFVGSGLSMYFLCSVLGMKRLGRLAASFFFMLNPFSLIVIWRVSHGAIQMPYSFTPLVLGLFIYGFKKKLGLKYIFLACLIWLLTTVSAYANPRMVVIHWLLIFFYFISVILFQPQERSLILKYSLKFILVWLGFNFYWLFPFIYSITESVAGAHSSFLMNDIDTLKLTSVKIIDSIRMLGYWALHSGYKGDPYHPYEAYYRSSLVLATSWLIPILVFLGLLNKDGRKKPLFFFFIINIFFGIICMAGPNSPFGGVLMGLYKAFPVLALLTRFTFLSFGISTFTIFAVLLGFGTLFIFEKGERFFKKLIYLPIVTVFILLLVVLVWPFWTGEVIARAGKIIPGERVKIPDYWWEAKKWFSEQKGFYRIFPLPMTKVYNMPYNWEEGYSGGDPIRWISQNPVIFANTGDSFKIPELIGKIIEEDRNFSEAGKLLGLINVKYVLNRKDVKFDFIAGHSGWFAHTPEKIEKFLNNQKDLKLVKTFGPWDIYEVAEKDIFPRIYVSQKIIGIDGEVEGLADLEPFVDFDKEKIIFFSDKTNNVDKNIEQRFVWKRPLQDQGLKNGLTEATYKFDIKTSGEYEILLRNDNLWQYYQEVKSITAKIDEKETITLGLLSLNNNFFSLGKYNFSEGIHNLTLSLPSFINLVDNFSFEDSPLSDLSQDAFDGKYSLKLSTQTSDKYILVPIKNFESGKSYKISFATKNIRGKLPLMFLWENYLAPVPLSFKGDPNENINMSVSQINLPATNFWQEFSNIFTSSSHSYLSGIGLVSLPDEKNVLLSTENLFDKITIQKFFDNSILLKRETTVKNLNEVPQISFKKISSVKYEVEITGASKPFYLTFSEAFHPQWKLSIPGEHFSINGFANGWYITKQGDYKIIINFEPQKIFYIGIFVSLATILLLLGYFGYLKIRKK